LFCAGDLGAAEAAGYWVGDVFGFDSVEGEVVAEDWRELIPLSFVILNFSFEGEEGDWLT
jgi:hypothetical protein